MQAHISDRFDNPYGKLIRMFRSGEYAGDILSRTGISLWRDDNSHSSDFKEIKLSIVPFSISGIWFAFTIDYFEEVFMSKKIYNYFADDIIKGLVVHRNKYIPCIDIMPMTGFDCQDQSNDIMILVSDSFRMITIQADQILRPEKITFNYSTFDDCSQDSGSLILKKIKTADKSIYILNMEEILTCVEGVLK